MSPMTLPWTGPGVPHAVLDINRGCDIRCRACYNARPVSLKSLSAIDAELDTLSRLRRLHAVTIAGGEPLLHPDLFEVIRRIKGRGFVPAMLTNGYAFDARRAAELAAAWLSPVSVATSIPISPSFFMASRLSGRMTSDRAKEANKCLTCSSFFAWTRCTTLCPFALWFDSKSSSAE